MKRILLILGGLLLTKVYAQTSNDTVFKKRALDNTEVNWLLSYYNQSGDHAAVTGGIGNEKLKDFAQNIQVSLPVSADHVLNVDFTVSAYTSASSSNLNPFTGASRGDDDDDDDDDDDKWLDNNTGSAITGTPWVASSGASYKDVWLNFNANFQHYSDDRNKIFGVSASIADEFDYFSAGGGLDFTYIFNEKNSEISLGTNVYFDHWRPEYPTEIKTYFETGGNLNADFFKDVPIWDENGNPTVKTGNNTWRPSSEGLIENKARNTYVLKIGFSQILSRNLQFSLFTDLTYQTGWLANPMQRVYFADKPNYYIGNAADIPRYTSKENKGVFQLADDFERLPGKRFKFPLGLRVNYYVNEFMVLRSYYRYYTDDWGLQSHTAELEVPLKISSGFTLYPSYRYYIQSAVKYFAPYEGHYSTRKYYTSDYDLSAFTAHQFGMGVKYTDIFTRMKWWRIGVKSIHLDLNRYVRSNGLKAFIISTNLQFVFE